MSSGSKYRSKNKRKENPKLMVFMSGLSGISNETEILSFLRRRFRGVARISFPKKSSSGYAFVTMKDEAAKEEILRAKNLRFKKRELKTKEFLTGQRLSKFKFQLGERRLFVRSLPVSTKDSELYEFFSKYGEVETAYIIGDRITKRPKNFGYVLFKDVEVARDVAALQKIRFKRRKIRVQIHQDKNSPKGRSGGIIPIKKARNNRGSDSQSRSISPEDHQTSAKKSFKRHTKFKKERKKFIKKNSPSFIDATGEVEEDHHLESGESYVSSENRGNDEAYMDANGKFPGVEEFIEEDHTNELDYIPSHHFWDDARAEEQMSSHLWKMMTFDLAFEMTKKAWKKISLTLKKMRALLNQSK